MESDLHEMTLPNRGRLVELGTYRESSTLPTEPTQTLHIYLRLPFLTDVRIDLLRLDTSQNTEL